MNRLDDVGHFRALFQAMTEGVIVHDDSGKVIRFNESALKLLDFSAEELLRKNARTPDWGLLNEDMTKLLPEDHPASIVLKTGVPQRNRTIGYSRGNGELHWFLMSAIPVYKEKNYANEVIVTFFDVTEERNSREKLLSLQREASKRERFLTTTLNSLPSLVSYLNRNMVYEYVNATYEKWFGVPKSDIIGKPLVEVVGTDAFNFLAPYVAGVLQGNRQSFSSQIQYKDAGTRVVQVDYIPDHTSEGIQGFYAIITDMTLQVLSEKKLQKQEEELRRILDSIPSLIGHWDKNLRNVHANKAYLEYFGIPAEDVVGMNMLDLVGEKDFTKYYPYVRKVLEGVPQTFEREYLMPSGEIRHALASFLPEYDDGEVIGFFVIVIDVTHMMELLRNEKEAREKAERATELRDEMVAIVSHDLRNPMSVALNSAEALLRNSKLDEKQRKYVERIRMVNTMMLSMMNDLLDLHKMQAGYFSIEENLSPQDVRDFLEEIISLEGPLAREKNIKLHLDAPPALPILHMNFPQLVRVMQNLIGNSLKFTPIGGNIRLRAGETEKGIQFEVEDSGPGIEPALLGDIFNRFTQARSTAGLGSGLGLAIVKGIVEAHGGEVHAENIQGGGARFTFLIPFENKKKSAEVH